MYEGVVADRGYVSSKHAMLNVGGVARMVALRLRPCNIVIQSRRRSLVRVFIADVKVT